MILGFEIGKDFRWKFALTVKWTAWSQAQENKRQRGDHPENDYAVENSFQQKRRHELLDHVHAAAKSDGLEGKFYGTAAAFFFSATVIPLVRM
jgi:hypothetical protein